MLDRENLTVLTDAISKIMNKEYVAEATITTSTDFDDYPIEKSAKKFRLKVKKMPNQGDDINGPDLITLTGSEKDIVSYFVQYVGANKKDTFKDLEQEFGEQTEATITTSTDFDDYPIEKQAKKFKLKVKKMPDEGDGINGYDLMTLTGSEKDIVSYFVKYMGANKKDTIKDLEQEFGEQTEATINEKLKPAKGKSVLDIDFAGEEGDMDAVAKKYRIKVKKGKLAGTALVAGDNKNILAYLQSDDYAMDDENIMDIYPEVVAEAYDRNKLVNKMMKPIKDKEALKPKPKPKKEEKGDKEDYEKFFAAALKKFGVDSPAELKTDEKKKEFFDYIDKNWEGKGEVKEDTKDEIIDLYNKAMDVKHGGPEHKAILKKIAALQKKNESIEEKVMENTMTEHVGANGHAGGQQDPNQGLSPKAKLVKAFQEPEAPEYADANKTALSTFANIMNSVNVVSPNRGSDVTEQDPTPENTIQKLANSTK